MEKIYRNLFINLFLLLLFFQSYLATGQEFPRLKITSQSGVIALAPGQSAQVQAKYYNKDGNLQNVSIKWYTEPGYLGKLDKNGKLVAYHSGEGFLFVKYRNMLDSITLFVNKPQKENICNAEDYPKVKIIPGNIKVESTDSVELKAFYINESGEKKDTFFHWTVSNPNLGFFSHNTASMFFADQPGKGFITASLGELSDTVKLSVIEPKIKSEIETGKKITILPGDTAVHLQPGITMQYSAIVKNSPPNNQIKWYVPR